MNKILKWCDSVAGLTILILLWLAVVSAVSVTCLEDNNEAEGGNGVGVGAACSPNPDNCLRTLLVLARQNPRTYLISVQGESETQPNSYEYSRAFDRRWHYDRKNGVMVTYWMDSEFFGYKSEWTGGKLIYNGVTDALLQRFANSTAPRNYMAQFENFCKANGCRVVIDEDMTPSLWGEWRK